MTDTRESIADTSTFISDMTETVMKDPTMADMTEMHSSRPDLVLLEGTGSDHDGIPRPVARHPSIAAVAVAAASAAVHRKHNRPSIFTSSVWQELNELDLEQEELEDDGLQRDQIPRNGTRTSIDRRRSDRYEYDDDDDDLQEAKHESPAAVEEPSGTSMNHVGTNENGDGFRIAPSASSRFGLGVAGAASADEFDQEEDDDDTDDGDDDAMQMRDFSGLYSNAKPSNQRRAPRSFSIQSIVSEVTLPPELAFSFRNMSVRVPKIVDDVSPGLWSAASTNITLDTNLSEYDESDDDTSDDDTSDDDTSDDDTSDDDDAMDIHTKPRSAHLAPLACPPPLPLPSPFSRWSCPSKIPSSEDATPLKHLGRPEMPVRQRTVGSTATPADTSEMQPPTRPGWTPLFNTALGPLKMPQRQRTEGPLSEALPEDNEETPTPKDDCPLSKAPPVEESTADMPVAAAAPHRSSCPEYPPIMPRRRQSAAIAMLVGHSAIET